MRLAPPEERQTALATGVRCRRSRRGGLVTRTTARHLPTGSRILQGGCGTAISSYQLHLRNYRMSAVDIAPRTVALLRQRLPEVNPTLADVSTLPFPDGSIDGYWSLGVIEHVLDDYGEVAAEMRRVLRRGGLLFLSFPYLNPLRRTMIRAGRYPAWSGEGRASFYQYALDAGSVSRVYGQLGIAKISARSHLGLSGVEDAWPCLEWPVDRLRSGGSTARAVAGVLNGVLESFAAHMILLVFRRG